MHRLAPWVVGAGFVAALAWAIVGVLTTLGDNDRYGKVRVPGEARLHFPAEDVILFYEERANLPEDVSVEPPPDLEVRVRSLRTREVVDSEDAGNLSSYSLGSLDGTSVRRLFVPEEGDYGVVARGGSGRTAPDRAVTFGPDAEIAPRVLQGLGIVVVSLIAAGVLTLLGRRARRPPPFVGGGPDLRV
jgi:hypothetical protein